MTAPRSKYYTSLQITTDVHYAAFVSRCKESICHCETFTQCPESLQLSFLKRVADRFSLIWVMQNRHNMLIIKSLKHKTLTHVLLTAFVRASFQMQNTIQSANFLSETDCQSSSGNWYIAKRLQKRSQHFDAQNSFMRHFTNYFGDTQYVEGRVVWIIVLFDDLF